MSISTIQATQYLKWGYKLASQGSIFWYKNKGAKYFTFLYGIK